MCASSLRAPVTQSKQLSTHRQFIRNLDIVFFSAKTFIVLVRCDNNHTKSISFAGINRSNGIGGCKTSTSFIGQLVWQNIACARSNARNSRVSRQHRENCPRTCSHCCHGMRFITKWFCCESVQSHK